MAEKYAQAQVKNRREVKREVDGKEITFIRFKAVLRYGVPNPDYKEKPEGKDNRTAKQKRKVIYKEISKSLEAQKVEKGRKTEEEKAAMTEVNIMTALQEWRDEMESEANKPDKVQNDILLLEYMRQYVSDREAAGIIEKSTAADYRHTITRLEKSFAETRLDELTANDVQRFQVSELRRGVSATTCGKVHRLLKQVLTYAVKHEVIEKNVMLIVEPPKRPKKRPNGLDVAEAQRVTSILLDMQPTSVCMAAFLALHASLRAGEVCALQWNDVDPDNMTVTVSKSIGLGEGGAYLKTTKNDSSNRIVNITSDLAKKLEERRRAMWQELRNESLMMTAEQFGKLFVCGTIDGRYLNPQILTRKWGAIAEAYNIVGTEGKRASFHTLRHGYATVGIAAGVDVASIAAQMGHSNIAQTLNTYTSATANGKRRAAATMGDAMHPTKEADVTILKTGTEDR